MNKSLDELKSIKEKILRKACEYVRTTYFEDFNINLIDFKNKKDLKKVLKKFRSHKENKNGLEKILLNQMITNPKEIPDLKQIPYDRTYYEKNLFNNNPLQEFNISKTIIDPNFIISENKKIKKSGEKKETQKKIRELIIELQKIEEIDKTKKKYFCGLCNYNHYFSSKIGKKHYDHNELNILINFANQMIDKADKAFKIIKHMVIIGY